MSFKRHLAAGIALTFGLVALTGSALAAPPSTPPGQEKKAEKQAEQQAQAPEATAIAPAAQSAPAETSKSQEQQAAKADSSSGINATSAGVKPSNNTQKNTTCWTGGSSSSPTCQPGANSDSSKRYGNGTTAAQIAAGRGAPAGTEIRGPGNSQPHKVCGKNGYFIDVHAVKTYVGLSCTGTAATAQQQSQSTVTTGCPAASTTTSVVGVLHNDKLKTNPSSAHFTKHGDEKVSVSSTTTAAGTCSTASNGTSSNSSNNSSNVNSVTAQTGSTSGAAATGNGVGTAATGGLAGAAVESGSPKSGSNGMANGVLGAFGGVAGVAAGGVLPFTGFPLWLAILVAIGLITVGWTLYRRGRPATRELA